MAKCPKTAEEAFKKLDKLLSEEDKEEIREAEDLCAFHFGLGMWIRNEWIHCQEDENLAMLLKDIGVDFQMLSDINPNIPEGDHFPLFFMHPDSMSSYILEAYQKYLKEK